MKKHLLVSLFLMFWLNRCEACGAITHIEISYRALFNFRDELGNESYGKIISKHQDALEAGNAFPDTFYPDVCFQGKYHDVSEDTHWTPFSNVTINYIRNRYPQPWDESTQKLVAFLMGVVSHQVADVSWHSLGIPQGFLSTMSFTNYHGVYGTAHHDGDLGGEVLNLYQLDLSYSDIVGEWYIPSNDLINIYEAYYGKLVIDSDVLETCSKISYLAKVAERLVVRKYFPITAKNSPFLVDNLYNYFLGGIEDMTVWTQRIWKYIAWGLEHGTQQCNLDHNPLFLRCNETSDSSLLQRQRSTASKNGFYMKPHPDLMNLMDEVVVKRHGRGITLQPSDALREKMAKTGYVKDHAGHSLPQGSSHSGNKTVNTEVKDTVEAERTRTPDFVFTSRLPYSKLGSAFAVADLDQDGNEDLVVGSPGHSSPSHQQNGMVFILFGTKDGLKLIHSEISEAADIQIPGPEENNGAHSQFGSTLSVVDFDQDGSLDIVVGAPSLGSVNLTYTGGAFVYSISKRRKFELKEILQCKELYCNLGSTLASGDLNSDQFDDIIIGSPFAPGQGEQQGMVVVVPSDGLLTGKSGINLDVSQAEQIFYGSQNYSWFGSSLDVKKFVGKDETWVAVGEPNYRRCSLANCTYNSRDTQAIGKVTLMKAKDNVVTPQHKLFGSEEFEMFGASVSLGRPYGGRSEILAVAATGKSVEAKVEYIPFSFPQVGSVYLYNLSNPVKPIAVFNGDRRYGRFGAQVKFADLNGDFVDDLIIGAPLRTKDLTEEVVGAEQGLVYIYYGGSRFPVGDATNECRPLTPVNPCPGVTASVVLNLKENLARFGSQIAVVKGKKKTNLLVTAENSSRGARLSGAIAVYNF
ncbi:phosphatidylinositol-glycan-specific phospholipase D [Aplysia californica]|uniref:Phosphatidylinositol-glycan-specific phospholipase D n=1 Tax=Aplysia californica TaxID=6500 RepID=A0ABM0JLA0_APLCA|nr:phosphatidylinositol-glycan-specific phospholipase D [Aplysia californica]